MPASKAETIAGYSTAASPASIQAAAASLRAPMRGEILVIDVTATSRTWNVPDGVGTTPQWKNRIVNIYADGADVYLQVSTGTDAAVDDTAVAVQTPDGATGRFTLTPSVSGNGGWLIPKGQWIPVAFGQDARTFAAKCAAGNTAKLRTHVAES